MSIRHGFKTFVKINCKKEYIINQNNKLFIDICKSLDLNFSKSFFKFFLFFLKIAFDYYCCDVIYIIGFVYIERIFSKKKNLILVLALKVSNEQRSPAILKIDHKLFGVLGSLRLRHCGGGKGVIQGEIMENAKMYSKNIFSNPVFVVIYNLIGGQIIFSAIYLSSFQSIRAENDLDKC